MKYSKKGILKDILVFVVWVLVCSSLIIALLMWMLYDPVTKYSLMYSEHAFNQVKVGMNISDVEKLLGEPLQIRIEEDGVEVWFYTEQLDPRRDYLIRDIIFDSGGKVTAKAKYYYTD